MTHYKGYRIEITTRNTGPKTMFVYDIYRGANHLLAGFSLTDLSEDDVVERMKIRVEEIIAEADAKQPSHHVHPNQRIRRMQGVWGVT
jgi:hypothetical protein